MSISEHPHSDGPQIEPQQRVVRVDLPLNVKMPEAKPTNGNSHVETGAGDISVRHSRRRIQRASFNTGWRRK